MQLFKRLLFYLFLISLGLFIGMSDACAAQRIWTGGGADELASNPANWSGNVAPVSGDDIVLSSSSHEDLVWDLNIELLSWTQDEYEGTVTIRTVYPGQGDFTGLTILNDCLINSGTWTHPANPSTVTDVDNELYRLNVTVGGNFQIGVDGCIDLTGKGYAAARGPGRGGNAYGGTYGGRGQESPANSGDPCYGSIHKPVNLGSGGNNDAGGGAMLLNIQGNFVNNGSIIAEGASRMDEGLAHGAAQRVGSGGSVFITSGYISGTGVIQANGGSGREWGCGGGGRVSLVLTGDGADFDDYTGSITAYSGRLKSGSANAGAGTVYLQTADQAFGAGTLIIDNMSIPSTLQTDISHKVTDASAGTVIIKNNGHLRIMEDQTLEVSGVFSNASKFTANSGSVFMMTDKFSDVCKLYGDVNFANFWFYDLTGTDTSLIFEAGKTYKILDEGSIILKGTADNKLKLRSSVSDTYWKLSVAGTADQFFEHIDLRDSDARSGMQLTAFYSIDNGHNENWAFSDFPPGIQNTWTGTENNLWSNGNNWHSGRAPVDEDSILINPAVNIPFLDGQSRTVADLEIAPGATLVLDGFSITVNGEALIEGELIGSGTETIVFNDDVTLSGKLNLAKNETLLIKKNLDFQGATLVRGISDFVICGDNPQSLNFDDLTLYTLLIETSQQVSFISGFTAYELSAVADQNNPKHLMFAASETVSLDYLTLIGSFDEPDIFLRSSLDGSPWKIKLNVLSNVRGIDVKDSDAGLGLEIGALMSINRGGNNNWNFAPTWITWTGLGGNNEFENSANWWPENVPDESSTVYINTESSIT
ncbi:MAG: hypothetical protein GX811_07915, partial [Lentisphaerae bacterium]|nr:hypothetical protein [Lentisphaerota bacterium]